MKRWCHQNLCSREFVRSCELRWWPKCEHLVLLRISFISENSKIAHLADWFFLSRGCFKFHTKNANVNWTSGKGFIKEADIGFRWIQPKLQVYTCFHVGIAYRGCDRMWFIRDLYLVGSNFVWRMRAECVCPKWKMQKEKESARKEEQRNTEKKVRNCNENCQEKERTEWTGWEMIASKCYTLFCPMGGVLCDMRIYRRHRLGSSGGTDLRYAQIEINRVNNPLDFDKYWLWTTTEFIVIARFFVPLLHCAFVATQFVSC